MKKTSILCPQCGRTSYNPNDIEQRYCGHCHEFHEEMFSTWDPEKLLNATGMEIQTMADDHVTVKMDINIVDLLAAVGAMQLACRHPGYTGPSKLTVQRLISQLAMELKDYPALVELIRRGGIKDYDLTDREYQAFHLVRSSGPGAEQDGG